ncbi:MAG: rod shape-determining protein MreC [bacterium]
MKKILHNSFIFSLLIIFCFIFLNYLGALQVPKNIFFKSTSVVQKTIYIFSLEISDFFRFFSSINNIKKENANLKQQNTKLLGEIVKFNETEQENEFFRQQMGLEISGAEQLILADIIGQDSSNLGRYFLINKGIKHGVVKKSVVITSGNILVGQVSEADDYFSKVQLITDTNCRVSARIQESGVVGLIIGNYESNLIFDLLPREQEIALEQTVVTSGISGLFPSGLFIGKIQKVISSDVGILQKAEVIPLVDFSKLQKVFIIKK